MTTKPINPKDSIGSSKVPMHLWPQTATIYGAMGFLDGALKYGRANYRATPVRASVYYDAALRHLFKWMSGESFDTDSGLHHFSHMLATIAIMTDAYENGTLIDDRDFNNAAVPRLMITMLDEVKRLQALHADKNPKQYSIADELA